MWLQWKSPDTFTHPAILGVLDLWCRRTGRTGSFFLFSLAWLHFHFCRRHRVSDCHFLADFEIARDLGIGITIDFPAVFPFLDCNHRVGDLEDRPGNLISLPAGGEGYAAERQTRCCQ